MDSHDSQTKATVFLSDFVNFVIRKIGSERTTDQEFRRKLYNAFELFQTFDVAQINTTKVANIAVIF